MNKRVEIKGNNMATYECILCGSKLTEKEYFIGDDVCLSCRRNSYHKVKRDYTNECGENKIDTILINKMRKEN